MKRLALLTLSIFATSLFFTASAISAGEDKADAIGGKQVSQQNLKKADDLAGMNIQNLQGEELGSIDSIVIDVQKGQVAYVTVTTGGLLGAGGETHAIPFNALQFDPVQENALTLDIDQQRFESAPVAEVDQLDRQLGQEIHQFYGVSPYWEESGAQQQQQPEQMRQQQPQQQPGQSGSGY